MVQLPAPFRRGIALISVQIMAFVQSIIRVVTQGIDVVDVRLPRHDYPPTESAVTRPSAAYAGDQASQYTRYMSW